MDRRGKWAVLWRSENKLDGRTEHLCWDWKDHDAVTPKLFRTRQEARDWKRERYGYIKHRKDLQQEPHGWMPPKVVKIRFEVTWYD